MDVRVGLWRKLSTEKLMLLNCGVGEDSWKSLGLQGVHPKGDQSWVFIGRNDVEAETAVLWLPDVKNWLIGKDPNTGKVWRQEEKGTTEDEMVRWHHQLNGQEFGSTSAVSDGQGGLVVMWSKRVGHDWSDLAAGTAAMLKIKNLRVGSVLTKILPFAGSFWAPLVVILATEQPNKKH